jgi:hypothetical protein
MIIIIMADIMRYIRRCIRKENARREEVIYMYCMMTSEEMNIWIRMIEQKHTSVWPRGGI